jgi:hypothetical protein
VRLSVYGSDADVKRHGQGLMHLLYSAGQARFVESAAWDDDYFITPVERRMFVALVESAPQDVLRTMWKQM